VRVKNKHDGYAPSKALGVNTAELD